MQQPLEILLADDHCLFRSGLKSLLQDQGYSVVGEARDGREAVDLALELEPDLVLMDVKMPRLDGIEATRLIRKENKAIFILAVTAHIDELTVGKMLKSGATGYVRKDVTVGELMTAISAVAKGDTHLSDAVAQVVVSCFVRGAEPNGRNAHEALTKRELEVFELLADGLGTKKIADRLEVSVKTIDSHRGRVMRKLQLRNLADLTRYALREGISSLELANQSS